MGLNIKNARTEAEIRELARLTGQSLTDAIQGAVREKLERFKEQSRKQTLEEYLAAIRPLQEAIATERRARGDTRTGQELLDELYDENGLPI